MDQAEIYDRTSDFTHSVNTSIMQRFSKMLTWKNRETILDIGIGGGRYTIHGLLPMLPKDLEMLIGCEYVPWKVEYARKTYPVPNVEFVEMDIQTRVLPEDFHEKFDHVFSFCVLNWVNDLRQAIENIFIMMKPGSEFLLTVVEKGVDISFYNLSKNPKWAPYNHEKYISKYLDVQDRLPLWKNQLQDAGFVDLNCFRENVIFRQESREICEDMYKSLNPIAAKIAKEDLEEYYRDYIAELNETRQVHVEICPKTGQEICSTQLDILVMYGKKPSYC